MTVTDNNQLEAFRFKSKEATPTVLKVNSERVFRRFASEKVLHRCRIDGTTIAPEVMSWLFEEPKVTKRISHEFNIYLHFRREVNITNNLGWLRSSYHSQIQQIARQDPAHYALISATSRNWWQVLYPYYMKAILLGDYTAF